MRNINVALLILTALIFNSCGVGRRVPMPEPKPIIARGEGWVAVGKADEFMIVYQNSEAHNAAVKELCSKEYICFNGYLGEAMTIQRRKK